MSRLLKFAAATLLCCAAAGASGQSSLVAENLLVSPPKDFKVGFKSGHDNALMTEWIPSGETVEDWTRMLTVQIYRHATIDAATYLASVGRKYQDACPGTPASTIVNGHVNGYVVSMLVLKCPSNPNTGKPETTIFRAIKGNDALYSVQRAWRSVPSDQELGEVMHSLAATTVCDTRAADHPCPSLESVVPSSK